MGRGGTLAVARRAGPRQWVWRAACARASPRPNRRTVDTGTAPGDRLRGNKKASCEACRRSATRRQWGRSLPLPRAPTSGVAWSGSCQRDVPKCLFWRHALTPLAGLYSELGAVSIGIAHVRRLFGAFEPKRYLPLSKIADGVRGAGLRAKTSTRRARGTHVVHWTGN